MSPVLKGPEVSAANSNARSPMVMESPGEGLPVNVPVVVAATAVVMLTETIDPMAFGRVKDAVEPSPANCTRSGSRFAVPIFTCWRLR